MIQVRNLGIDFGSEWALKNIDLDIPSNTTCAIIGPSGCGKTTLLCVLAGLLVPTAGQVLIDGQQLRGIRKNTGLILQNNGLLPWKTTWKNVELGLRTRQPDRKIVNEKVYSILKQMEISEFRNKYPAQLSGGQKQRTAIARTLVLEPDILLLDEASSALDAITREQLQNLILEIYKNKPTTLVLVTHSIEEAVFLGQKIVVMKKAQIKHIMSNPFFGDADIRTKPDYYNVCMEVRKRLCGDA
ncbi:MAG: ABC transporter ATP-binding protein [Bacillota bacterium]|nr:ABC transporter ATP-binding protein [Bacillota bacterium]